MAAPRTDPLRPDSRRCPGQVAIPVVGRLAKAYTTLPEVGNEHSNTGDQFRVRISHYLVDPAKEDGKIPDFVTLENKIL